MSDRPTPETDAQTFEGWDEEGLNRAWVIDADLARRLERQRNELLDFLTRLDAMACDDEFGSSDFRKTCRYDIPKVIAAAKTSRHQQTPPTP